MMTRKVYVEFVNVLGSYYRGKHVVGAYGDEARTYYDMGWLHAVWAMQQVFSDDNDRFDGERFVEALEYRIATGHLVGVGQKNFDHNPFKCRDCMERVGYDTKGKKLQQEGGEQSEEAVEDQAG